MSIAGSNPEAAPRPVVCEEMHVERADEVFAMLNRSHSMWDGPAPMEWVYRGQSDADWRLIPSIHRDGTLAKLRPLLDQFARRESELTFDELRPLARQSEARLRGWAASDVLQEVVDNAEYEVIRRFADLADELRLDIEDRRGWHKHEITFSRSPTTTLALAQHHGVPTSLLDWTHSPRVAALFAVEDARPSRPAVVWALRADFVCPVSDDDHPPFNDVRRYRPIRKSNSFLHAQDGLFTWHAWDAVASHLRKTGEFPSVEDIVASDLGRRWVGRPVLRGPAMRKIVLSPTAIAPLRELLWKERVSRAHLMPTFDNVARATIERL